MAASSRGSRAIVPLLRRAAAPSLCTRCATLSQRRPNASSRRPYSTPPTTTTTIGTTTTSPDPTHPSPYIMPVTAGTSTPPTDGAAAAVAEAAAPAATTKGQPKPEYLHPKSLYRLRAGLILSRPPILTREQTSFEKAFYLYQKRLNERLATPFARQFFFRPGQPASVDFAIKLKERGAVMAREIGKATRTGRDTWDDELLVDQGAALAEPDAVRETLYVAAESRVSEDGEPLGFADRLRIERPQPRVSEADRVGDVRRLDRRMDRTLYLVVQDFSGRWGFPQDDVRPDDEDMYETVTRALEGTAGVNMNTWIVGRHPVAHEHREPTYKEDPAAEGGRSIKQHGQNVFYLKGRIMAGQADLTNNQYHLRDFKWLTKDELKETLQPGLYSSVEASMPAQ